MGTEATCALVMLHGPYPRPLGRHACARAKYPTDANPAAIVGNVIDREVRLGELVGRMVSSLTAPYAFAG